FCLYSSERSLLLSGGRMTETRTTGACMSEQFRFGIEEEYFLVDAATKLVARRMPEQFFNEAQQATDGHVSGEFLQSQIELVSSPHTDIAAARTELKNLRQALAAVAAAHGLAILAAGTHPTALWSNAVQTPT